MKLKPLAIVAAAMALVAAPSANAATMFSANLAGTNETPPTTSLGGGTALLTVSTPLDTLTLDALFFGLKGKLTRAHIHCCAAAGAASGVAIGEPSIAGFPLGGKSGIFSGVFNLLSASTYTSTFLAANGGTAIGARNAFIAGLLAGNGYINLHTTSFPGGEVRGQFVSVAAVPEPSEWGFLLIGMGASGMMLRWRSRDRSIVRRVLA
jgi:hypothetical protein